MLSWRNLSYSGFYWKSAALLVTWKINQHSGFKTGPHSPNLNFLFVFQLYGSSSFSRCPIYFSTRRAPWLIKQTILTESDHSVCFSSFATHLVPHPFYTWLSPAIPESHEVLLDHFNGCIIPPLVIPSLLKMLLPRFWRMLLLSHKYISQCCCKGSIFWSLVGYNKGGSEWVAYDKSSPNSISLSPWIHGKFWNLNLI